MRFPRLHKETSLFDRDKTVESTARTATDYITEFTNAGIWVTPSDAKPNGSGAATSTTTGWHISDALELWRQGVSMFKVWAESSVTKVRVGVDSAKNILMDGGGISLMDGQSLMARIEAVTNMTTANGRLTFDDDDRAYIEGGHSSSPRRSEVSIGADHGEDGDTSPFGHNALIALTSEYDSIRQAYRSDIVISADELRFSDSENSNASVGMQRAQSNASGGYDIFSGAYSDTYNQPVVLGDYLDDGTPYRYLLVEFEDGTGRRGSVWVDGCDKSTTITFGTQTTTANATTGLIVRSKTYELKWDSTEGAYVINTAAYGSGWQYGKVTIATNGTVTYSNAQEIGITRVIGFY